MFKIFGVHFLKTRNFVLKSEHLTPARLLITLRLIFKGSAVAQSVERATPGEEVPGSIPAVAARSLLVVSVSV